MSNWQVPELEADFSQDFEDMIINYIYQKWSINNPAKGSTMQTDYESEPDTISFKSAFPDYFRPYECAIVQTRTEPLEKINGKWTFSTGLDIMLRMKRIERDAIDVDPQLENMEQEIQRIVEDYVPNEIQGIKDLIYDDNVSAERVYNARDTWAKADWRSIVHFKVFYEKEDTP